VFDAAQEAERRRIEAMSLAEIERELFGESG